MRRIAVINQKGGVGKTTSVMNIGYGLTQAGKKVLLVDLDPQAHLTYSTGIAAHELEKTIYEVLKGENKMKDIIIKKDIIDIAPSNLSLSGADVELSGVPGREFLLKEALEGLDYDFILFDCPPSLGILTVNALVAASEVFIPLQTEYLALQGISTLLKTIDIVKKRLNSSLEITGVIATRFSRNKRLNREVIEVIKQHFNDKLFNTYIRENISLAEAPSFGKSIFEYKPKSYGAIDYSNLCKEILTRGNHE